jgi:hypothetical protein
MNEKRAIEAGTLEAFLRFLSDSESASYRVVEHGDAPDFVCRDDEGRILQVEIVTTEDRTGDMAALLGRSNSRSIEELKRHLAEVRVGHADPLDRVSQLDGNVVDSLIERLRAKLLKRFGQSTALVIRDTSGVDWDWDLVAPQIRAAIESVVNPYDRGVWVVNRMCSRVFRIV